MISTDYPSTSIPVTSLPPSTPPESWAVARRLVLRVARPLERYMHVEASSGIVLLAAACVALVWANSPWGASYEHLWHTPIALTIGSFTFAESLHFVINDGLMVIFFFVVGLEIRREIHQGELSDLRRATLPGVAALGGMLMPAAIYFAWSAGTSVTHGWGVPMATDIAFAVGVLALLGKRVPAALRVLLLALAIIDDIGAIIVIAVFFSSSFAASGLVIAAAGIGLVVLMQRLGVRKPLAYVPAGVVLWVGMLRAGVHPTIAGVILGLLTPVRSWFGKKGLLSVVRRTVVDLKRAATGDDDLLGPLARLQDAQREAVPPVVRLQAALHPWVAFGIMPLFALANAGVNVSDVDLGLDGAPIIGAGVVMGLVVGKPAGILLASFLSVKMGLCALPRGVDWKGVTLVGAVAGIGFTMAIFVAGLAFDDPGRLGIAKLAVLVSSGVAAGLTLFGARFLLPREQSPEIAGITVDQAERSTDY